MAISKIKTNDDNHMHRVEVSRSSERLPDEPEDVQISSWLRFSLDFLGCQSSEVSVHFVKENEAAALNARYRGYEKTTNVLSFPSGITLGKELFLGDIVISSEVVRREAAEYGVDFVDRYAHMLVHGLLHLIGYDHIEESERNRMEHKEKELLLKLGMGNPYE